MMAKVFNKSLILMLFFSVLNGCKEDNKNSKKSPKQTETKDSADIKTTSGLKSYLSDLMKDNSDVDRESDDFKLGKQKGQELASSAWKSSDQSKEQFSLAVAKGLKNVKEDTNRSKDQKFGFYEAVAEFLKTTIDTSAVEDEDGDGDGGETPVVETEGLKNFKEISNGYLKNLPSTEDSNYKLGYNSGAASGTTTMTQVGEKDEEKAYEILLNVCKDIYDSSTSESYKAGYIQGIYDVATGSYKVVKEDSTEQDETDNETEEVTATSYSKVIEITKQYLGQLQNIANNTTYYNIGFNLGKNNTQTALDDSVSEATTAQILMDSIQRVYTNNSFNDDQKQGYLQGVIDQL